MAAVSNGTPAEGSPAPAATNGGSYIEGIIYPPPDIRSIVDKTASFIAKNANPAAFEDKIRERSKQDKRFTFVKEEDAYHAYYLHQIEVYKKGEAAPAAAGAGVAADGTAAASQALASAAKEIADDGRPTVPQPRPFEFMNLDRPPMAAVDHDILKLTALFTARSGRQFTSDLQSRESGNYQFDFLKPSHSLFGYFNRLVEQYTKVLMAPQETLAELDRTSGHTQEYDPLLTTDSRRRTIARREIMSGIENRVEWQKYDNARRQAEDTAAEEERVAFASIDWQDFIVVSTIDFTEHDELLDLPPPMSRHEVENMTLAQKKMAAMIMEGKDVPKAAVESGAVSQEAAEAEMQMSDDEAEKLTQRVQQTSNAPQEAKLAPSNANGPIKIRKDYVPKASRAKKIATTTCRICGQEIPENEIDEHVRIELLDPRWKERQMAQESKRSAASMLQAGTDVASSLRQIASRRTDIFSSSEEDQLRRKKQEEEERIRKREREKVVWDGHTASAITTSERFQSGANLDEQIAALHKAKGLTAIESNIGPRPAPAPEAGEGDAAEQGADGPFFRAPGSFAGATLSAAPNPQAQNVPGIGQTGQYIDPARMAQMQYQTGQARPAEQSDDPNKRQRQ